MSTEPPGEGESDPRSAASGAHARGGDGGAAFSQDATVAPAPRATSTLRELQPGDLVGGYRIEHVIGQGGMGTVYGAIHPLIGKRAAIKVLRRELCTSPEAVERFIQEARAVNQIGHPNIVDAFGFGALEDGRSWCAMEWLRGETLAERLERRRMNAIEACAVLGDVIRALEAAHAHGIVHRDLKPENIFLVEVEDDRPRVKLLDFGIAKLTGGGDVRIEKTRTGALVGTPAYIAPEQARGLEVDARTDVYSLGVMTYELLAGAAPFEADNAADLIAKHLTETPRPLRERVPAIPAAIEEIVMAMLAKSPSARPPLARVKAALAALAAGPRLPTPLPVARAEAQAGADRAGADRAGADRAARPGVDRAGQPAADRAAEPGALPAVRFAPAPEAALELAVAPRTPTTPVIAAAVVAAPVVAAPVVAAAVVAAPGVPGRGRGSGAMIASAIAIVIAAGVAVFLIKRRGAHEAAPAAGGDAVTIGGVASASTGAVATGGGPGGVRSDHGSASPPAPADATLDVTLIGASRATISIDGDEHPLWKGAPETIPIPAGRHDVTVTASGFRTFHTSITAAAGGRLAVTARLEPMR